MSRAIRIYWSNTGWVEMISLAHARCGWNECNAGCHVLFCFFWISGRFCRDVGLPLAYVTASLHSRSRRWRCPLRLGGVMQTRFASADDEGGSFRRTPRWGVIDKVQLNRLAGCNWRRLAGSGADLLSSGWWCRSGLCRLQFLHSGAVNAVRHKEERATKI